MSSSSSSSSIFRTGSDDRHDFDVIDDGEGRRLSDGVGVGDNVGGCCC